MIVLCKESISRMDPSNVLFSILTIKPLLSGHPSIFRILLPIFTINLTSILRSPLLRWLDYCLYFPNGKFYCNLPLLNGHLVLVTKNSCWHWAKSVTCFTNLGNHNRISLHFEWDFKIADDVLDNKLMCSLTVKICCLGMNSSEHLILLSYFKSLLL